MRKPPPKRLVGEDEVLAYLARHPDSDAQAIWAALHTRGPALYPVLVRLERKGLLEWHWNEKVTWKPRKRLYSLKGAPCVHT